MLAGILAFVVGVAVALLVDGFPTTLPPLAWMVIAAVAGLAAAFAIPLLLEDLVHRQVRRFRPEAERQRAIALIVVDGLFAFLLLRFAADPLQRAIGRDPGGVQPAASAPGSAAPSASAPPSAAASGSAAPATSSSAPALTSALAPSGTDLSPEDLFDARADTVVVLLVRASAQGTLLDEIAGARVQVGSGSGFVVDPAGLVVTNEHVIHGGEAIHARLRDGRTFEKVTLLAVDAERDLALLQLPVQGLAAAPLTDVEPRVGARALAIGSPRGLEFTLTDGIVSAFRERGSTKLLQFQTTIAPGSSGGPLFDARGRVIGVTTETQGAGLNAAVRVEHVRQLLAMPRAPRELAAWGGLARVEDLKVEGPTLGPSDRGNLENVLRAATMLFEPCLRDAGPPSGSLTASATWPPGGQMKRLTASGDVPHTTDVPGPPGECLQKPAKFFFPQLLFQMGGIVPAEYRGKVVTRFKLVVPGAPPATGRALDVRLDVDAQ